MEYRMYCLAERHLSSIQKAIQSAHAIVDYGMKNIGTEEYSKWGNVNKTIVVLDGGTAIDLMNTVDYLNTMHISFAVFKEPDMQYMLTSIAFLADERVWDYETYGRSWEDYYKKNYSLEERRTHDEVYVETLRQVWIAKIGGLQNAALKELISDKRLAI